ncbi:catalase-like domain-containing protein [Aspergillus egyptiacus]|nr:catalase-like domain-containing protein [Aspergillus egyptiacus]
MVPGIEDSPDPLLQFRMFFYRDAQYHRIGVNLHQIPVNCPFMSTSYSSLNFDGPLRVDANHGMNPQYAPNSFTNKFRPDAAEAPYTLADNTVGRKSHFFHEGKPSEYDQPRALYNKVMDAQARQHLHHNTARLLKLVEYPEIQLKYLAQVYRIAPEYAKGVYDLLPEKKFAMDEVEERSKGAERLGKEAKFCPSMQTDRMVGMCPVQPVYNV